MTVADQDGSQRQAIRRALVLRIGAATGGQGVADATIRTWYQIAARLTPVIGLRGFDSLFSRALHLTSAIFPWLVQAEDPANGPSAMSGFRACLEARDAEVAMEASCALLWTFNGLLVALIGESLAERLLGPVWTPPPPLHDSEPKP